MSGSGVEPDRPGPVDIVSGDPGSCSALGGALRRQAATLRERRTALWHSATGLPDWTGWAGGEVDTLVERLRVQLAEIDRMVGRLDAIGSALQGYATDLAHARGRGAEAVGFASRHGLRVDESGRVGPRTGPLAVEVALGRRAAMPLAQHQVDGARGEGQAGAARLRRRTTSSLQELRADAGRLVGLDSIGG